MKNDYNYSNECSKFQQIGGKSESPSPSLKFTVILSQPAFLSVYVMTF